MQLVMSSDTLDLQKMKGSTHVHDFRDLDQGDKQKTLFYPVRSL